MSEALKPLIAKVADGYSLNREEAERAFAALMTGEATDAQIGGFLMALRVRGETVDEMAGAVSVMRAHMRRVEAPDDAIDIVGTGGDGAGTLNVSTCAAFVLVGCGLPVAKHGNRALSSRSGAADVLGALGIDPEIAPDNHATMLAEAGLCFMFAPAHHAAMRFVGPARRELGTRTLFNLLGPMSNPADVKRLVIGAFSADWIEPMAETLRRLGTKSAWVVHGDGLDELSVSGRSDVAVLKDGVISRFSIEPEDVGLARWPLDDVKGGDGNTNARALKAVLDGARNAYRDIVVMNAGAGLVVAEKASDLRDGVRQAAAAIDDGRARAALDRVATVSQRLGRLAS